MISRTSAQRGRGPGTTAAMRPRRRPPWPWTCRRRCGVTRGG
ncbi:hypothetical protein HU200_032091 [Digitaria exilis]|uniref:Uncharacterized protein n=1 Tax=Digitaria exilis TaxID=1010633 RepID=A0A835BNN8_9POAL|nr:hypothetical protein HU200_032091 [Digitaria exilis]